MSVSYALTGKTAIVTGGSKGIGRAIVEQLKASGARVWNWDMAPLRLEGVRTLNVDVTDAAQIDAAISQAAAGSSRIDILVNNAGLLGAPVSVEQLETEDWRRVIDIDLTSVFEISRRVVPHMRRSGWGRIVNMASVAAKEGFSNLSAYSSAGAGVVAFTKALGARKHRDTCERRCSSGDRYRPHQAILATSDRRDGRQNSVRSSRDGGRGCAPGYLALFGGLLFQHRRRLRSIRWSSHVLIVQFNFSRPFGTRSGTRRPLRGHSAT